MPLRWGDLDAFNHVNNVAILKILEEARIRAFWTPAPGESAPPTAVIDATQGAPMMMLIARQEIEYHAPIPYHRDPIDVQLWFSHMGGSSVDVCYEVYPPERHVPQVKYVTASATAVVVDADTGAPQRLPAAARAAWEPYLCAAPTFRRR
ncbi:thioesterase family protein [Microbacterium sediminicola]